MTTPEPADRPLLVCDAVYRSFYGVHALSGADLTVRAGTITGLIGPNGAGKTTLFNCISGVIPPERGRIAFDGVEIAGWPPHRVTEAGLIRTFQIARGFPRLTVLENLMLYGARQPGEALLTAIGGGGRARERELLDRAFGVAERLNLGQVANNPASDLSGGQKKLLEIGRALMADPKLILLDEPIAGVNPTLALEIGEHLHRLREEGLSFLIIEHHMDAIARLCDPVVVMAEGRKLAEGSFTEIAARDDVQEAYMGGRKWAS